VANNVAIARFTDTDGIEKYRVTDNYTAAAGAPQAGSRLNPGAGCTRISNTGVKCPVAGVSRISVLARDQNDAVAVASTVTIPTVIDGGSGNDVLGGGAGPDQFIGSTGDDRMTGNNGNDRFSEERGANGADRIDGGANRDTVEYSGRTVPTRVSVNGVNDDGADATGDGVAEERDNVFGTVEIIRTGSGADTINSLDGDLAGSADDVSCGAGADSARADPVDAVAAATCEIITRT
jgi:Ca2+-binding RTX toxin-like protein